jgi:hypothetical protein
MSTDIEKAIESLYSELETLNNRSKLIKTNINNLSALIGNTPPFNDTELSVPINTQSVRPDQFFRKGLATAVKEYLKMKGSATPAKDIFETLKSGGFEFDPASSEAIQFRGLTISLGKNTNDFVYIKSNNSYGLAEFYPDKKAPKGKKKNSSEANETQSEETQEEIKETE